jgi:hypothetical protein
MVGMAKRPQATQIPAIEALFDSYQGVAPVEVFSLSYTRVLWMGVRRKAAYLPG